MRLIQSLPTPAIAAAGGPCGLLNITRLLAAQDLAKGITPSFGEICCGEASGGDRSSVESATDPEQGDPHVPKGDSKTDHRIKFGDTPSSEQDSSLKVMLATFWLVQRMKAFFGVVEALQALVFCWTSVKHASFHFPKTNVALAATPGASYLLSPTPTLCYGFHDPID